MAQIKMLTGVVEVGLFCKMARAAYFGNSVRKSGVLPGAHFYLPFFRMDLSLSDGMMEKSSK
jgi:hypothetical protein